ncbi:nitrite reductase (NADH) small subunit [Rubricella aquisinus]|uniref:Nitrite reductase (NADH) small subunit n=1 Tax=Rubricella aquisinus TaxID=2028108 RepID=A0A840X0I8_9RHOB|nr:nitrite reductase small subunit NirD [Rubricella aquisinus]MBB5514177.1 nitrite reductase (NADH) small subunit [Rubricella aquisinus]
MTRFIDIGHLDDIPTEGARVVKTPLGCVAVFRTAQDEVFAIDDRCPHKGGPLSNGIQHGRSVTCPLHNWVISLESGMVEGMDEGQVATWPVEVRGGRILMDVARLDQAMAAE